MSDYVVFDEAGLDELFDGPNSIAGKELTRRTIKVESAAKRNAPVDTGRLRSSITREMGSDGGDLVGRVGTNVHYARHVELGTSRMVAQPYLRPALDAAR